MSEEWRESILEEGYKKFPKGKVDKKMASKVVTILGVIKISLLKTKRKQIN